MFNTEKVIGFYTDVFGNEVDEYEQEYNFTVWYKGQLFEGDKEETEGYNRYNCDDWEDAKRIYDMIPETAYIIDNRYGVTFQNGEWDC